MERTVIVGDIHGCHAELVELLAVAEVGPDDLLVSVGDLVDRGPAPAEVVRLFRERPNSLVLMGNHERKHVRGVFSYAQEITRLQAGAGYADMVTWMATLPYWFENEHVRVVHAALVPGVPLAEQREEVLCGSTRGERELKALFPEGYWHERYTDSVPVVFGHHVTGADPLIRDGRIFGLDTGACHGGYLTALSVPDFTLHRVRAHADHWTAVRRTWQLPVLRSRPWAETTWDEIDAAGPFADPASSAWVTALREWAFRVRAVQPAILAAAQEQAARSEPAQFHAHPAAPLLFQARAGRLDAAALDRLCTTPERLCRLAAAFGIEVESRPA
ncbi:metallophosphoesterase family protein [Nocardia sp. NPDC057353]|uniref:metallophosphoesterase family protein n=1 Tax=Nocardia sp. NPDC057353 TaxID=3346104 RepID=UPI003625672A